MVSLSVIVFKRAGSFLMDFFRLPMRISRYPASWQEVKHSGLEATGLPEESDHGLVCGNGWMGRISTTQTGTWVNLIILEFLASTTLK